MQDDSPPTPSHYPSVRKSPDLLTVADSLRDIANRFTQSSEVLLGSEASRVAIAEVRECMANAGRVLLTLLRRGTIEPPSELPAWLEMSCRAGGRRPMFAGTLQHTSIGQVHETFTPVSLKGFIRLLITTNPGFKKRPASRRTESVPKHFRHRHVHLEAITGWLGVRYGLQPQFTTPTEHVSNPATIGEASTFRVFCVDLVDLPNEDERLFFLNVARASAEACSLLARDTRARFWKDAEDRLTDPQMRESLHDLVEKQLRTGVPTDEDLLNGLRDGERVRALRAELQVALDLPDSTDAELFAKWKTLASWRSRFATGSDHVLSFRNHVGFMRRYDKACSEAPTPVAWAIAFRETTLKIAARCMPGSVSLFAVHRLVQLMDDLLDGSPADISEAVREVDLTLRVMAGTSAKSDPFRAPTKVTPIPDVTNTQTAASTLLTVGGPSADIPPAPARMTGMDAAKAIGISPSTLSRWRSRVPAWARSEELLFRDLIDRDSGEYRRDRVLRLRRWFEAAHAEGGQRPVKCP